MAPQRATFSIGIDATAARRSVNGWVGSYVADMLMAAVPTLILSNGSCYRARG